MPFLESSLIKKLAEQQGFLACGIAEAEELTQEQTTLSEWLAKGYQGEMGYMQNHFEKRTNPVLLVDGAKSVVVFLYNYFPSEKQNAEAPKVAKYAYGNDYHFVIKSKLNDLLQKFKEINPEIEGRVFVDSAPVMERQWAVRAGLGWLGKNTLLLRKQTGSYFFIGSIISNIESQYDSPVTEHCGTCTACIEACPTDAFVKEGVLDASKCISYLTIELKDEIPEEFNNKTENWVFGCDICQEVCPWNRFAEPHEEPEFKPLYNWLEWNRADWQNLDSETFNKTFKHSAMKRAGLKKILASLNFNE